MFGEKTFSLTVIDDVMEYLGSWFFKATWLKL